VSEQSVPKALGPLLDSTPEAVLPRTFPEMDDDAPVFSAPPVAKLPPASGALPSMIVFVWLCPSAHRACHVNMIESTELDVTTNEIGRPWLVVPAKLPEDAAEEEWCSARYPPTSTTTNPTAEYLRSRVENTVPDIGRPAAPLDESGGDHGPPLK
jgi:hypothetical protein